MEANKVSQPTPQPDLCFSILFHGVAGFSRSAGIPILSYPSPLWSFLGESDHFQFGHSHRTTILEGIAGDTLRGHG